MKGQCEMTVYVLKVDNNCNLDSMRQDLDSIYGHLKSVECGIHKVLTYLVHK